MIAAIQHAGRTLAARPWARIGLQAAVSAVLVALLFHAAQGGVFDSLSALRPGVVAAGAALLIVSSLLNSRRWQLLLDHLDVRERFGALAKLYFIGQFCSLFLPTSAGGDAVRVVELTRRHGRLTQTVVATLQERLLGLGASLFLGLLATLYYLPLLPAEMRVAFVALEVLGTGAAVALLYPAPLLGLARRLWPGRVQQDWPSHPLVGRVVARVRPIAEMPPLAPRCLAMLCALSLGSVLLCFAANFVLARSLGIAVPFLAFCLVVPLVWIVRMLPVSLNGIGVGEGAFVYLLGLFAVPQAQALALAIVLLGLQTGVALLGGGLLLLRMMGRGAVVDAIPAGRDEPRPPLRKSA